MTSAIHNLLNHNTFYEDGNSSNYTHISMHSPKGKFSLDRNQINKLFDVYGKIYNKKDMRFGIGEKPDMYVPILVDVDLKREGIEKIRLYDDDMVYNTIKVYQDVLREIVKDIKEEDLVCVLLEKNGYMSKNNVWKNGYHLHFPYIYLSQVHHTDYLLPNVKKRLIDVYKNFNINDVIDKGYVKSNWLLYGCSKGNDMEAYRVTKVFNGKLEEITLEEGFMDYEIFDNNQNRIQITKENLQSNLPRILSIKVWGRNYDRELVDNLEREHIVIRPRKKVKSKSKFKGMDNNMGLCDKLLDIISTERVDDHNESYRIGCAIYNVSGGSKEGLDMWKKFSSRITKSHKTRGTPDNFNYKYCDDMWERLDGTNSSIGTIKWFAKIDNKKKYDALMKAEMDQYLNKDDMIAITHNDIAKAMYEKCGSMFVCSDIKNKVWWMFNNHTWIEIREGTNLREKISNDVVKVFNSQVKSIKKQIRELDRDDSDSDSDSDGEMDVNASRVQHTKKLKDKERLEKKIEKLHKIMVRCGDSSFKNNVMRECAEVFYVDKFELKLDSNKYLFGFRNGIYDLKKNEFRNGIPEDYITKVCGVEYKEFKKGCDDIKNLERLLVQWFPDKSIRKYFLDITSDVYVGGNFEKTVAIWSGDGDNGKSILQMVFEQMFGDYAKTLPTSLITGKRTSADSASPCLHRVGNGVRWVVIDEPESHEVINTGLIKQLTGNDKYYSRPLYKEGREIKPMFKMCILCNRLPNLSSNEQAVWNRMRVIPFQSTFKKDAPKSEEEQLKEKVFPKISHFEDLIPDMITVFNYYLLTHRKNNINKKRETPRAVLEATDRYKRRCDIYDQYVEERIVKDQNSKISITSLYADFKVWFKENVPNQGLSIKNEVKEHFEKKWGDYEKGCKWKGYRLKRIQEEIDDGDVMELTLDDMNNHLPGL